MKFCIMLYLLKIGQKKTTVLVDGGQNIKVIQCREEVSQFLSALYMLHEKQAVRAVRDCLAFGTSHRICGQWDVQEAIFASQ